MPKLTENAHSVGNIELCALGREVCQHVAGSKPDQLVYTPFKNDDDWLQLVCLSVENVGTEVAEERERNRSAQFGQKKDRFY